MDTLIFTDGRYRTQAPPPSAAARLFPSFSFYRRMIPVVFSASSMARRGVYDDARWHGSSRAIVSALEAVGVRIEAEGIEHVRALAGPCVFIGNHMSTLETFVLPSLIVPFRPVTFVVKEALVEYPVFKYVMRSRNPITVGRTNPREDLKAVLEGGAERLKQGISLIIFPQTTRIVEFDAAEFNTIGVKLAKKAGVPVVPLALKTDAWGNGNGKLFKDFGPVDPSKAVHFAFGAPLVVKDRGAEEHEAVIEFITGCLRRWGGAVKPRG